MRYLALGVLVALVAVATATAGEGGPPAQGPYTYGQAVAAGLIPTMEAEARQLGIPVCPPPGNWPGYKTQAEAEKAIAAAPEESVCFADPRGAMYSFGGPTNIVPPGAQPPAAPSAGAAGGVRRSALGSGPYYYMGAESLTPWQGVQSNCEVGNPTVDHPNPTGEFMLCGAYAGTPLNGLSRWTEVGWIEGVINGADTGNTQKVFKEDETGTTNIQATYNYSLSQGVTYNFRARDFYNGSGHAIVAEIFWAGAWQTLGAPNWSTHCADNAGNAYCVVGNSVEVYSSTCYNQSSSCPQMNAPTNGDGISFYSDKLRPLLNTWIIWGSGYAAANQQYTPYTTCWVSQWDSFRAKYGAC